MDRLTGRQVELASSKLNGKMEWTHQHRLIVKYLLANVNYRSVFNKHLYIKELIGVISIV